MQSICIFGYCIFPICVVALICGLFPSVFKIWLRIVLGLIATLWSSYGQVFNSASIGFMACSVPEETKLLACYPILLFYSVISWFVILR